MTPEQIRSLLNARGMCGEILGQPDDPHACILPLDHVGDHGRVHGHTAPPVTLGHGGATIADVATCQQELLQLVTAWADRGLSPAQSAELIAGTAHAMLAQFNYDLEEVLGFIRDRWNKETPLG